MKKKWLFGILTLSLIFGLFSSCSIGDELEKPAIPDGVTTAVLTDGIRITWNPVKDAESYIIYRKEGTSQDPENIATVNGQSSSEYADKLGTAGKTYQYAVAARNSAGTSDKSSPWTGNKEFPGGSQGTGTPSAPSGLQAAAQSASEITITWVGGTNATGYKVYRSGSIAGTYTSISGTTLLTALAYTDTGLTASTDYFYKVTALNADGESSLASSTAVSGKTLAGGATVPGTINWDSEDGTLTIINNTHYDMVLFKGLPSITNIIGGVRATSEVIKDISDDVPDFDIGGPMVIRAMKKTEYDANINDLSKGRIDYSVMAAYGKGKQFRATLTSQWDGNFGYKVTNRLFNRGIELRSGSLNGEKIAYLSPAETDTILRSQSNSSITIFPVFIAYNTQSKSLVTYEATGWRETQQVAPRAEGQYDTYQFPPQDIELSTLFNNVTIPYATLTVQNNATRIANFRLGQSNQTAQSNNPQISVGRMETYDIVGGTGEGIALLLNLSLVSDQVQVPVRFAGSSENPKIKNGYIYNVTLTYGGADIMIPSNYTAIITEGEKIDVDQFLVAE